MRTCAILLSLIVMMSFNSRRADVTKLKTSPDAPPFEMVDVKGGTYTMGGMDVVGPDKPPVEALLHGDECPHTVIVYDFQIGKYEVTQAQWEEIMGENPSKFKDATHPVERVSWEDIQVFIKKVNTKYNEQFRLPTEAEWEFAARGGLQSRNYRYAGSNNANEVSWWQGNSGRTHHPVGELAPNELGIYDMSGNIHEFCEDWKTPYPCNGWGKSFQNVSKILRGGMYQNDSSSVRVRDRNARSVNLKLETLGFRLAK